MVRPTGTKDVPSCNNRFAPLDENYSELQNRRTLQDSRNFQGKHPPLPPPHSAGQGFATQLETADSAEENNRWFEPRTTHTQVIQGKLKQFRDRSASTKRKGTSCGELPPKAARLEISECPHLKVIDQNKAIFKKVLDSLTDYSGENPLFCDAIRDLSLGMNGINDILGVLMAERLIPGESPEILEENNAVEGLQGATGLIHSSFPFPQGKDGGNHRKHLQQAPLGDHDTWAKAVGRKQLRRDHISTENTRDQSVGQSSNHDRGALRTSQADPFTKAVKDAERSILVFNLNLGNTPIMNPNTISGKVTLSLLNLMKAKEETLTPTQGAKEFIDDILSQVVKMEFFGTKTSLCKHPGNSALNGSFYTIPVKMMFKDRKGAQTASELLRECIGLSSTTPYHRSLRAAITLAVKMIREENPGYQAKANLDLNGKTLKCFIRTDTTPPGNWAPYGRNIPLPNVALDPSSRDFSNMTLQSATSHSPRDPRQRTRATDNRYNSNQTEGMDFDTCMENGNSGKAKTPPSVIQQAPTEEELQNKLKEVNKVSSPLPEFMLTPRNKGKSSQPPSGRRNSSLVQHSPPPADKSLMSSLGS
jgi:hypothetical protein